MPPITSDKVILLSALAALMIFVIYFEWKVLRRRSKEVRTSTLAKDEAFNSVLTTRSVIVSLQRQGTNTQAAQSLVDQAKLALQRGDYGECKDLCDKAKAALTGPKESGTPTKARTRTVARSVEEPEQDRDALLRMADEIVGSGGPSRNPDSYSGTTLRADPDGNYMSAKFEINKAKANITDASNGGRDVSAAEAFLADAEHAFEAGSYTKALSLAIKSRKSVVELAEEEAIRLRKEPVDEGDEGRSHEPPQEEASEESAGECRSCGAPLEENDLFCHKCGTRIELERECQGCGTVARIDDTFCRKCGSKID